MSTRAPSRRATVGLGVLAGVLATALFALIFTVGWCADAAERGESSCGSLHTSLIGIETNVWLWAAVLGPIVLATVLLARRRRPDPL